MSSGNEFQNLKSAGKMINDTLKNVQKWFQFVYYTQTDAQIE